MYYKKLNCHTVFLFSEFHLRETKKKKKKKRRRSTFSCWSLPAFCSIAFSINSKFSNHGHKCISGQRKIKLDFFFSLSLSHTHTHITLQHITGLTLAWEDASVVNSTAALTAKISSYSHSCRRKNVNTPAHTITRTYKTGLWQAVTGTHCMHMLVCSRGFKPSQLLHPSLLVLFR